MISCPTVIEKSQPATLFLDLPLKSRLEFGLYRGDDDEALHAE